MNIYLIGHDYKYAVEQMLLTLLPNERPKYPKENIPGKCITVELTCNSGIKTASCLYVDDLGDNFFSKEEIRSDKFEGIESDSENSRLLKNVIYKTLLYSGIKRPVWGSLTGVRPGKLMLPLLEKNMTESQAIAEFIDKYDVSYERAKICFETSQHTSTAKNSLSENDVCLYVGIPFCPTRCAYCSFISVDTKRNSKYIAPFVEALKKEIECTGEVIKKAGLRVVSVYFGGGTPTSLSPKQLDQVFEALYSSLDLSSMREFTVEAGRPDTITEEKIAVLNKFNVDRISVNPQTMSDSVLETIGRKHTAEDISNCYKLVREYGNFAVNMDLIAGLPSDNVETFKYTIDKVIELNPENITVHTLSRKKGADLYSSSDNNLPSAQEVSEMLDYAQDKLREAKYSPYYLYRQKFMSGGFENIGWSKEGFENLYNICIMEEIAGIIAMGAGASTKLIAPGNRKNERIISPKFPKEYIDGLDKILKSKEDILSFYEM